MTGPDEIFEFEYYCQMLSVVQMAELDGAIEIECSGGVSLPTHMNGSLEDINYSIEIMNT